MVHNQLPNIVFDSKTYEIAYDRYHTTNHTTYGSASKLEATPPIQSLVTNRALSKKGFSASPMKLRLFLVAMGEKKASLRL